MSEKTYHHGNLRNELIEAGITLINENGLEGFSLRKVAAKCEVSHAAPYSHFKDIDALVDAMGEHVTQKFMDKLHSAIAHAPNSRTAITLLGKAYIEFFEENPLYFQFLFYYSRVTIDLDQEGPDDYPPFALFRTTVYDEFRQQGLPEEEYCPRLIFLWSCVHGIASMLSNSGIRYSGDWQSIFTSGIKGLQPLKRE